MLVLARKQGQLGNRLLLYSHLIACAREHDLKIVNVSFYDYANLFESTSEVTYPQYPPLVSPSRIWRWKWPRAVVYRYVKRFADLAVRLRCTNYPVKLIRLYTHDSIDLSSTEFLDIARRRRLVLLQGWRYRNEAVVRKHADAIRDYFQPLAEHRENVARAVKEARGDADVLVGVHIRHGDFAEYAGGKFFYTTSQYADMMRQMQSQLAPKKVRFLACSNAPQDMKEFGDLPVTMGPGHLLEDMYSLAGCDYIFGAPSTYTIWASFFGQVPSCLVEDPDTPLALDDFAVNDSLSEPS